MVTTAIIKSELFKMFYSLKYIYLFFLKRVEKILTEEVAHNMTL